MSNRPIDFGPFDAPYLIAHQNRAGGCKLIVGDQAAIEADDKINLTCFNIYILPANMKCRMQHDRQTTGACRQISNARMPPIDSPATANLFGAAASVSFAMSRKLSVVRVLAKNTVCRSELTCGAQTRSSHIIPGSNSRFCTDMTGDH